MHKKPIIVWDLGGTKCNVGVMQREIQNNEYQLQKKCTLAIRDYSSLENLIFALQEKLDVDFADAQAVQIGAAGCFDGEELHLVEGYPYPMPFTALAKKYRWPAFQVMHDYLPVACATYTSYMQNPNNVMHLNKNFANAMVPYARRVAVGVGTGLGLKDIMQLHNGQLAYGTNEMGHIGISVPPTASADQLKQHEALVKFLHAQNQMLTFEKILSGCGTLLLHDFLYPDTQTDSPEALGEKVRNNETPELLALFAWYLGLFIGTVQLSFMPEGGVWLTGGVILKHPEALALAEFWEGVQASPAYWNVRETFPVGVLLNPDHALYGGAFLAELP